MRDPPCLVLQWVVVVVLQVVSMITAVGNANEQGQVTWKVRTDGEWGERLVKPPKIFKTYNMKMNAVDRSDQILSVFSTQQKCVLWWKTLFFDLIDIAVVNTFILFQAHRAGHTENERRLGIRNVIFATKFLGKSVALRSMVIALLIIQKGKGLNPQSLKPYMFPVSLNRGRTVLCAINRKRPRERFSPIVPPHNVRVNIHVTKE